MWWVISILGVVLLLGWGWFSSNLILRLPRLPLGTVPEEYGISAERVQWMTEDGLIIRGWFIPGRPSQQATIIILHGWGANRSDVLPSTFFLSRRGGYHLLYFDFRNHGESEGTVCSLGGLELKDFSAAVAFLRQHKPQQSMRIGVYGLSMGAAVAIVGAAQHPEIQAVVAESPFASYQEAVIRMGKLFYGFPRLAVKSALVSARLRLGFDPEEYTPLRHVDRLAPRPLLLIHAARDQRVTLSEVQALYAAAGDPKTLWTVPDADHGEVAFRAPAEYERRLLDFFHRALTP